MFSMGGDRWFRAGHLWVRVAKNARCPPNHHGVFLFPEARGGHEFLSAGAMLEDGYRKGNPVCTCRANIAV